jgi:hypothetical protein
MTSWDVQDVPFLLVLSHWYMYFPHDHHQIFRLFPARTVKTAKAAGPKLRD